MNRPLRKRHLLMVSVLAPIAALFLVAAIMVRRHAPDNPPVHLPAAGGVAR